MRSAWAVLMLSACLEKIETLDPEAGTAGDATLGGDGGGEDGGPEPDGEPRDGESRDGGDVEPGPFRFATMVLPSSEITVTTIWGRSSSEMYAGTANGNVLTFDPNQGWTIGWHEPSNFGIRRIRGTATKIFVASQTTLWIHDGQLGVAPRAYAVGSQINDLHVVSDDLVYLVADQSSGRGVYRYDGTLDTLSESLDVATLYGTWVEPDGTLIVSGNGKIFRYSAFAFSEDPIAWPSGFDVADKATFDIYDVARVGDRLFAVGDEHHVLELEASPLEWRFVYEPMLGESLEAVAPLSTTEAYAVGRVGARGSIARYASGAWTHIDYPDNHNFFDAYAAGSDEVYFAGTVGSTLDPVVLRGTR